MLCPYLGYLWHGRRELTEVPGTYECRTELTECTGMNVLQTYRVLCRVIPGVRIQQFLCLPGTSVSYVRPCHNTRNFCEFCNTSIPLPKTSGTPIPLPEFPNRTQPCNLRTLVDEYHHTCAGKFYFVFIRR